MTSPVFTPLQMFYSTSGLPLTDGYIYIGTASQNPQTNPIAVYWDAAGTIPAAQPIRTSGGYPVRNGSPATVFVLATDFSLIVRDKSSKLVFSRLSGNVFSAEWMTYTPAGTSAVATTVQAKLRESVSVLDFGAASGASAAVNNAAFTAALATGKSVFVPEGSYSISVPIVMSTAGQTLYGASRDGCTITQTTTSANGITITGGVKIGIYVKNLRLFGSGVSTASGMQVTGGNEVYIDDVFVQGFSVGISGINTNQIYLNRVFAVDNLLNGLQFASSGGTCVDTTISNSYSAGNGTGGNGNGLAFVGKCSGIYISKLQLQLNLNTGLYMGSNGDGSPDSAFFSQILTDSNSVNGYNITAGSQIEFNNCWASNRGTGYNWYLGATVRNTRIIGGKVYACAGDGITIAGANCSVVGTVIASAVVSGAAMINGINVFGASAIGTLISGVHVDNTTGVSSYFTGRGILVGSSSTYTLTTGCNLSGPAGGYLDSSGSTTTREINNVGTPGAYTFGGTMTAPTVVSTGDVNMGSRGQVAQKTGVLLAAATIDIPVPNGRGVFVVTASNVSQANSTIRTQTTFSVFVYDTESSVQQIHTANGSGGACAFTVTLVSSTAIRLTNTSGISTYGHIAISGTQQF